MNKGKEKSIQIYNYFYLNEMNNSSIRKPGAEWLRKFGPFLPAPCHSVALQVAALVPARRQHRDGHNSRDRRSADVLNSAAGITLEG